MPNDDREQLRGAPAAQPAATPPVLDPENALADQMEADGEPLALERLAGEAEHPAEPTTEDHIETPEAERPVSYERFKRSLLDEKMLPETLRDKMTAPAPLHARMVAAMQEYELGLTNLETEIAAKDLTDEEKSALWESSTELASAAMLDELVNMINEELSDDERRELVAYLDSVGVKDVFYIVNFSRNDSYIEDHPESLEAAPVHMNPVAGGGEEATEIPAEAQSDQFAAESVTASSESIAATQEAAAETVSVGNEFTIDRIQELFLRHGESVDSTEDALKLIVLGREHFSEKSTGLQEAILDNTQKIKIHILATALRTVGSFNRVDKMESGRDKVRAFVRLLTQEHLRKRLAVEVPKIRATK